MSTIRPVILYRGLSYQAKQSVSLTLTFLDNLYQLAQSTMCFPIQLHIKEAGLLIMSDVIRNMNEVLHKGNKTVTPSRPPQEKCQQSDIIQQNKM